ncbi:methyltransferase [Fusarium beomiforme]|uniref:Methyltransferase n=1 Tax=Fusarium beomiforme TaxID=44412 RepID=A0A9P5AS95_9HYPO|nr:methyltransferase [Fusarium beomiforme]
MQETDSHSFSLISEPGIETIYTPTDQESDDYEFIFDDTRSEGLQLDDCSSCCTSLTASILDYEHSHGRRYHAYLAGRYPLPNDEGEQYRELAEHFLMQQLLDGRLFLSEVGKDAAKIIDLGTGNGAWVLDVADEYDKTSVIGTDLSPIQPKSMPPNASMFVEDCEDPYWANGKDFDLVHLRGMAGFLLDLDTMVANAHEHIKDGGWIEFQDFDYTVRCDDGTMQKDDPLRVFFDACAQGIRKYGCTNFGKKDVRKTLIAAGFTRVQVMSEKVPISCWSQDEGQKDLGKLMEVNISDLIGSMAAKPLNALGIPEEERKKMVSQACKSLKNAKAHRYMNCRIIYGQKIRGQISVEDPDSDS